MRGVAYDKQRKKWRVRVSEGKKRKHLGYFETEKEAINCLENYKRNTMPAGNEGKVSVSTQTEEMEEIITRMIKQKIE